MAVGPACGSSSRRKPRREHWPNDHKRPVRQELSFHAWWGSLVTTRDSLAFSDGPPVNFGTIDHKRPHCANSLSKALASFNSNVSKPSVNQP
jgi:hypothetical protein